VTRLHCWEVSDTVFLRGLPGQRRAREDRWVLLLHRCTFSSPKPVLDAYTAPTKSAGFPKEDKKATASYGKGITRC
jgi:hypothetical protein